MTSKDSYSHIEKRILSAAKFRLKQTIDLQNEEIERLKKLRSALNHKIDSAKTGKYRPVKILLERKKRVKQALVDIERASSLRIKKEIELQSRIKKQRKDAHAKRIEKIKKEIKVYFDKILFRDKEPEQTIVVDSIKSLIAQLREEKEKYRTKIDDEIFKEYGEVTANNRVLEHQINILEQKIDQEKKLIMDCRSDKEAKLKQINTKLFTIKNIEKTMPTSPQQQNDSIENSCELEKVYIDDIKAKIIAQKLRRDSLLQNIELSKQTHGDQFLNQQKQIDILRAKVEKLEITDNSPIKTEIQALEEKNSALEEKLTIADSKLKKLREVHIKLLSAIKATDYLLNGRHGRYQRYQEINGLKS